MVLHDSRNETRASVKPLLPFVLTYKLGRKKGARTMRIVNKSRGSRLEMLNNKYLF